MLAFFYRTTVDNPSSPLLPKNEEPLIIPEFNSIPAEKWAAVKDPIRKVVNCVCPTLDSEDRRKDVIHYMQKLIGSVLGAEVFAYGSVPLKTYLPEGDIDLTAISTPEKERDFPDAVLRLLKTEARNPVAEFKIRQIKFINAEVKIVKCIIGGIIVDLSFNQLGGLCSLCFLEQADRIIAKDHLFKRSIILIKSWCYYESRISGASYGLLSTYTLEILILYIFYMYNASLTNPLMVLYRFLEYYGDFDCENFCISIDGPVKKSLLPNLVVENPINCLLSKYLKSYINMFSVPCKDSKAKGKPFALKFLNIIDPLKENNNLGRSVNKGSFLRIRYALRYGARKLGKILELPNENIPDAVKKFFTNTLRRHYRYRNIPPVLTFPPLSSTSNTNVENEVDASLVDLWNADLGNHIFEIEGTSKGELSKGNDLSMPDLSASGDHSLNAADEKSDVNANSASSIDSESGSLLYNFRNSDSIGEIDETENETLNLVKFTGDYDGNVRNLVYSECCRGFPFSAVKVHTVHPPAPYTGDEPHEVAAWFHHNLSYPYPYPYGPVVQTEPHVMLRGTGSFIPAVGASTSTGRRGREYGSPTRPCEGMGSTSSANQMGRDSREQSPPNYGQSCPRLSNHVTTQRRLEFGSFGPVHETSSNVMDRLSSLLCASRTQGNQNALLHLQDDMEFPPLAL